MTNYLAMGIDEFRQHPDYNTHYWTLLGLWRAEKEKLATAKDDELHYRLLLCQATFTDPVEGSNVHAFGNTKKAAKLTLKQPINRKIDEAAIGQCLAVLRETLGPSADEVVRWKPELAITNWRKLTEEQKDILAPAVTSAPGTPQLEFTDAKD